MKLIDTVNRVSRGLAVVLVAFVAPALLRGAIATGDVFPPLADMALDGPRPETAGKIVIVDFFASWCAPCKASIPALSALQAEFAARGVVVIGIGIDEQSSRHAAFVKKVSPKFSVLHDREQKLVRTVEVPTMPTTFVLGRDGRVLSVHTGFHGADSTGKLRAEIEKALAEKP